MSFTENVALLAITAALTGLLVPTVKAIVDQRHFKEQRRYEAELARQSSVIAAQVQLLDNLATAFWDYILALIAVSYFHVHQDEQRAEDAFAKYQDESARRFGYMQAEFSKARRLVSADQYVELQRIYASFLELDVSLMRLQRSKAEPSAWQEQHTRAFTAQGPVSTTLARIADEMQLAAVPA
jgi:hypothetical protein